MAEPFDSSGHDRVAGDPPLDDMVDRALFAEAQVRRLTAEIARLRDERRAVLGTVDRLAEAMWDARECLDPSGGRTGFADDDQTRRHLFWSEAVERDLWPASRQDTLAEARLVLDLLAQRVASREEDAK